MRTESILTAITGFAAGAAFGAGLMYLLDPDRGRRRRTDAGNRLKRTTREAADNVRAHTSDLRNRTRGVVHDLKQRVGSEEPVDDATLRERVRSSLGHAISDTRDLVIAVDQGRISLAGEIDADEKDDLLHAVGTVPGVRSVRDLLHVRNEQAEAASG